MKAIQKTKSKKSLSERVTAMEGDPRGAFATWGRRMAGRTRSIFIVLRHGILSLYSYIRKFVPWRSRTYIQNLRNIRVVGLSSSFLLGLLALAIIIPLYNVTGTEDTEAATGTAIDSSITFTSTRATATVDLTPTSASGTFASSTSGTTDAAFSITTTNSQGYELKIKSTSSTVLKPTTTTSDSDGLSTISTSGITSSSFANNTWGYLPNYYNCNEASGACTTNTTNYYPATTSDVTLRKTTSANNTAHNYTIGLGAKADLTKTSGTYTLGGNKGSLVLTYVANPTIYSIAYDKGKAASDPGNMPSTQSGSVSATSVTLSSNTPTLTGYTFTGWCLGEVNRSSAEVDSCTGTGAKTFAAGGTFGIDRTSTNSVTLHAMWSKATVNVTVNFAGSGVTGVTFANDTYGNVTVSTSGNTAALKYGVQYDITGTYSSGYEFSSWAATAGSLGSTTTASTTYSTTTGATLTLTGKASAPSFTINFGTGIAGVIVKDSSPEGGTVATVTTSGTSVPDISVGSKYYLLPLYNSGYTFSDMTTSGGTKTVGDYGYYYYTIASGTNTVTVSATTLGTSSSTNMQGLTDANCTPYPMAVKDTRDDEVYYVQRLADGKCWMLENLRLDLVGKISNLTTENTNVDSTSLSKLQNGGGSTSDQYATAGVANWTSSNSYSVPRVNISDKTKTVTGYGPGRNYVGGYYNYCAASAGSYCYGNGTSAGTSSGNASYDICPAGWHMPSTTSSNNVAGSYYYLYNTAYSANASNFRIALSTPLSGVFNSGSANSQGSYGTFWSSTRNNNYYMYNPSVYSSYVIPADVYGNRELGYSVRCVTTTPPTLYETIASMSKGNFDMSTINTSLTTENSGVYKYTGSHSDNGTSDIYFYRGIIDSSFDYVSIGSLGDGTLYPNYVKLTTTVSGTTYNTCWRIFRTTASGGVKMIYNGLWTGSTCANGSNKAQLSSTTYYNSGTPSSSTNNYGTKGFIAYAGYNYNNTYAYNNTSYTSAIDNNTLFTNSTASNIRTKVENWYTSTLGTATNSLLESNAGYCNDRSTYNTSNTETTTTIPYGPSTQTNFGAYERISVNASPSLACPYPSRDLLTTSNGLGYPVALITLDEAVLAGNGYGDKEAYARSSYLTSGLGFWLLSPYDRDSGGRAHVAVVATSGYAADNNVYGSTIGVRPVISLKFGTTPASGSGTAIDPWVVQ